MQRLPLPETVPSGVELWLLKMNLQTPVPHSDLFLLSEDEHAYASRFRRHEDQVRYVATRAALRRILASRLKLPPDVLRFVTNRHGKPSLQDDAGIEFNVSHAGCFALIALSTSGQVGVDIEYRDRGIDAKSLGAYVFSPLERESGLITDEDFIERWVVKESVLKALGEGISEHLQTISILPGKGKCYRIEHDRPEWAGIQAWSIEAPDGYAAALAVKE
jgi:4'-phosphopantetheinyl transferase